MAIESKMYQPPRASFGKEEPKKKFSVGLVIGLIIFLAAIIFGGWFFFLRGSNSDVLTELQGQPETVVSSGTYQAVFLDNGQVYFGELEKKSGEFWFLKNVYYLQYKQNSQSSEAAAMSGDNTSLVKLGNEMHGPEDKMEINKEHILFVENLKGDSKVSQAIADYLSKKNNN